MCTLCSYDLAKLWGHAGPVSALLSHLYCIRIRYEGLQEYFH